MEIVNKIRNPQIKYILDSILEGRNVDTEISAFKPAPYLLDPILSTAVSTLAHDFKNKNALDTIYQLSITTGFKVIVQYFPTDIKFIQPVLDQLNSPNNEYKCEYVLLLWLSALVLVPFDLDKLKRNLSNNLTEFCLRFLHSAGVQRDMAAFLLSRLLTRKDPIFKINEFTSEHCKINSEPPIFVLQTLAYALKRGVCKEVPVKIQEFLLNTNPQIFTSSLSLKLFLKVLGRSALLDFSSVGEHAVGVCVQLLDHNSTIVRTSSAKYLARLVNNLDTMGFTDLGNEVVDEVQNLLHVENMEFASMELFSGSFIFMAELLRARKNLGLPYLERLVDVLEFNGLHFIQHPVQGQVGQNVRDAACYVCWSLFRYVDEKYLNKNLQLKLFTSIIMLACADCEVNLRRAAAAALQEGLGRLKSPVLPNNFDKMALMSRIGYLSVNSVGHCYLELIPSLCFTLFTNTQSLNIVDIVVHHGLNNSNAKFRRLAARCLAKLVESGFIDSKLLSSRLLSNEMLDSKGKLLALGYTNAMNVFEVEKLLNSANSMPEYIEACFSVLHLVDPQVGINFLISKIDKDVPEDNEFINMEVERAGKLLRPVKNEYLQVIKENIHKHFIFVKLMMAMECFELLDIAFETTNPLCRALLACKVDLEARPLLVIEYLTDYTTDKRGDVGLVVRESMLKHLKFEKNSLPTNALRLVWKMAAEPQESTRQAAMDILKIKDYAELLDKCPQEFELDVAEALSMSVSASLEIAVEGLLKYLKKSQKMLILVLNMSRTRLKRAIGVLSTLQQLVINNYTFPLPLKQKAIAIAYNTTLEPRTNATLMNCAIDVLQYFALENQNAHDRLIKMSKTNKLESVRLRCCEAEYELMI